MIVWGPRGAEVARATRTMWGLKMNGQTPDPGLLVEEKKFFVAHKEGWLQEYAGRFPLIHGTELTGDFETREGAVSEGLLRYGRDPFLVRTPEEEEIVLSAPALTLGLISCQP